jgi:hypothetical protein
VTHLPEHTVLPKTELTLLFEMTGFEENVHFLFLATQYVLAKTQLDSVFQQTTKITVSCSKFSHNYMSLFHINYLQAFKKISPLSILYTITGRRAVQ